MSHMSHVPRLLSETLWPKWALIREFRVQNWHLNRRVHPNLAGVRNHNFVQSGHASTPCTNWSKYYSTFLLTQQISKLVHYDSCQGLLNQNNCIIFGLPGWMYTKFKTAHLCIWYTFYLKPINKEIDELWFLPGSAQPKLAGLYIPLGYLKSKQKLNQSKEN